MNNQTNNADEFGEDFEDSANPMWQREEAEPHEGAANAPWAYVLGIVLMFVWGTGYLVSFGGETFGGGDLRSAALPVVEPTEANGAEIFASACASCHQAKGQGVPGAFPPLVGSKWVSDSPPKVLASLLLRGINGKIEVANQQYQGAMPAIGAGLSDLEVAATIEYITETFGKKRAAITASDVEAIRKLGGKPIQGGAGLQELIDKLQP